VIPRIDVHAILQASVPGLYTDLVTRPTGRVVREHIERAIVDTTVALIDFTGVGCIDYSCADEIVAKLVRERVEVLLLRGLTDGHRLAIEPVLVGHGLAVVVECADGSLEVLGPPDSAAALREQLISRQLAHPTAGGALALTAA